MAKDKKLSPAMELIQTKKQLAKYKALSDKLKVLATDSHKASKPMSSEELAAKFDADDTTAVQKALNDHTTNTQKEIDDIIKALEEDVDKAVDAEYADDKVNTQAALAVWNAANGKTLTYEDLTTNIPPRIVKQFEDGTLSSHDELFGAAEKFLDTVKVSNPTNPGTPPKKDTPDNPAGDQPAGDNEEEYY